MKFKTRLQPSMALIDLTPLVDVIFLMLIFFIVTSDILPLKSLLIENPKLEKTSQLSGLTLCMREREHFFEPRFLKALAIALILHGGALFLFHVSPFDFSSTFTFPPIHVQSDSTIQGVSTLVDFNIEEDQL